MNTLRSFTSLVNSQYHGPLDSTEEAVHEPIRFRDSYDPKSIDGHRKAVREARENRTYKTRMVEIEAEHQANKSLSYPD